MVKAVSLEEVKIILLDIEGTTTSISFVKDTLFPYARQHLAAYLENHWKDKDLQAVVHNLRIQAGCQIEATDSCLHATLLKRGHLKWCRHNSSAFNLDIIFFLPPKTSQEDLEKNVESAITIPSSSSEEATVRNAVQINVLWQMDQDRKATPLKTLQGMIWKQGYQEGTLKAHLYKDVSEQLEHWHSLGKRLYIYSSGSVPAQKLLFGNTLNGSLLKLLSGFYDTTTGPKTEAESYRKIAKSLECQPREILFLTDIPKEAEAAKASGMHPVLVVRPGNAQLQAQDEDKFPIIHNFRELE